EIQSDIGADIQMVLDVCPPLPSADSVVRSATERTTRWAVRGREAFLEGEELRLARGLHQAQFGISQGGIDTRMRAESARQIAEMGLDGAASGGLYVGQTLEEPAPAVAAATELVAAAESRYLMGVGALAATVLAIALAVELSDCVLPSRHVRHVKV